MHTATATQNNLAVELPINFPATSVVLGVWRTVQFAVRPLSVIDLVAIAPTYVGLIFEGSSVGSLAVLRLLRLFRILRLLRHEKVREGALLLSQAVNRASLNLVVFMLFTLFAVVILGSLEFYTEQGSWSAVSGQYVKLNVLAPHQSPQPSLHSSIPTTFWWVITSLCTVGYGDITTTTTYGQVIGTVTIFTGTVLLGMTVTIIGASLTELHQEAVFETRRKDRVVRHAAKILKFAVCVISRNQVKQDDLRALQRAWRTWRQLIRLTLREEFALTLSNTNITPEKIDAMISDSQREVMQVVHSELQTLRTEVMAAMADHVTSLHDLITSELNLLEQDQVHTNLTLTNHSHP